MRRRKLQNTKETGVVPRSPAQPNKCIYYFAENVVNGIIIGKYIQYRNCWETLNQYQNLTKNDYSFVCIDDGLILIGGRENGQTSNSVSEIGFKSPEIMKIVLFSNYNADF